MAINKLTRREFLRLAGASAAFMASGAHLSGSLLAKMQAATQIVFGGWGATAEDNGVQAAIQAFQAENPNIEVTWQITPAAADYMQQLLTNFAANTAPDTSFITSDSYETLRKQGLLMDITERVKSDPLLGQEGYFIEPQESNRCADDNGNWHGIGSCWVAHQLYYNAELLEQEGIPLPGFKDDQIWTWDKFLEYAKQLTIDANGRHPGDAGFDAENIQRWAIQWPMWWMPIGAAIYSNGGSYVKDGMLALDSPEAQEAMQRLHELIYVHHVAPRTASLTDLGMSNVQMLDNGRLAIAVDGSWALSFINPSLVKNIKLGTGALPMMKEPAAIMQAHFHSVIANTQHPEEAWQWVRYLATPFYQTQFLKIGLWLPSQTALATPEGLKSWLTPGIHTDNYADFVTDYLPKHGKALRIPAGYIEADSTYITPGFQALEGGSPVDQAIGPDVISKANEIIAKAQ
jgi:multiple sugar transport system substrate-binding protein